MHPIVYVKSNPRFVICNLNSKIFVTTENEIMKKALIGSGIGVVILLITIFVVFGRKIALFNFVSRLKARKRKKQEQNATAVNKN